MFVGSPVGAEEKEVLPILCMCVCVYNSVCSVAGAAGQETEERESECGYHQLWRRGRLSQKDSSLFNVQIFSRM